MLATIAVVALGAVHGPALPALQDRPLVSLDGVRYRSPGPTDLVLHGRYILHGMYGFVNNGVYGVFNLHGVYDVQGILLDATVYNFDRFGDARIVLLGEATHGTHEFYAARSAITRHLIERHGFNVVAVEGDWPDIARIDDYVRHEAKRPGAKDPFARFPTWMWRNQETLSLADWLRRHNATREPGRRASVRGLDVYSLGQSIHAVVAYLEAHQPHLAQEARKRYSGLLSWQEEPQRYGQAVEHGGLASCEDAVVEQLGQLLAERMHLIADDGEAFFDAEQNARIARSAEGYYRAMYRGAAESWNLRDRHMFDTLLRVMAHQADARVVVWAHNSHIGDASATAMGWNGEFNIGQVTVSRTMRPTLDAIAVEHHTLTDEATMPFVVDKSIKQAFATQSPVVFILSPLLTGGNPAAAAKLT